MTRQHSTAVLTLLLFASAFAHNHALRTPGALNGPSRTSSKPAPVKVLGAFVQATPPGVPDGSAYLTIQNTAGVALKFTGGDSPLAQHVMPMRQARLNGLTGMRDVPFMAVPANGKLAFTPGANHLMLYQLKRVPKEGETTTLTLNFDGYAPLTLKVPVKRL